MDAIRAEIPDFRESYELPEGMFRTKVPAFDEAVVRRRNDGLARVFHDLKLMEREGSGIDLMYERLLSSGRAAPSVKEGPDSVHVAVPRRVVQPGVIRLLAEMDSRHQLTQRERITLALLAQTEGLVAAELSERLELDDPALLRSWLGRLPSWGLVEQAGRTSGTRYFVPPALLRDVGLDRSTTLTRVQPHRLRALILEDLERFPDSAISEIHRRVGLEIPSRNVKTAIDRLLKDKVVEASGERRWRKYRPASSIDKEPRDG